MAEIETVGFVGIGNMGAPMAGHLARGGYRVIAYDLAGEKARRFAAAYSAEATESLAELGARSDAIITMLPSGREVRAVLIDAQNGALASALRSRGVVIDMSSSDPVGTRALGAELGLRGIALVDAPVSGGVPRAKDASLTIMIGGDPASIARVKPVLARLGQRLFEVGSLGCGHAMKALNNFFAGTSFAAALEAVAVGCRFGLDPAVMTDIFNVSTGRNFATENLIKQHVLSGSFSTGFALGLLAKDVKIASDLAAAVGVEAPVACLVSARWSEARDRLGSDPDHTRAAVYWGASEVRPAAE